MRRGREAVPLDRGLLLLEFFRRSGSQILRPSSISAMNSRNGSCGPRIMKPFSKKNSDRRAGIGSDATSGRSSWNRTITIGMRIQSPSETSLPSGRKESRITLALSTASRRFVRDREWPFSLLQAVLLAVVSSKWSREYYPDSPRWADDGAIDQDNP